MNIGRTECEKKRLIYCTIFSSSPGKYFSLIGHRKDMGRTARHLDQLITKERLNNLGLKQRDERKITLYFKIAFLRKHSVSSVTSYSLNY